MTTSLIQSRDTGSPRTKHTTVLDDAKYLLPDETARLQRHLEDEVTIALARGCGLRLRNAVFAQTLLGTGLRVSEAVSLLIGDIVLDGPKRLVRVRRGKGGRARDVVIGADLRKLLRLYIEARNVEPALEAAAPLFPAGAGTRCMSRISGWRVWKAYLGALDLDAKGRGCHAARHTRATMLYAVTRDLRLVGRELGHSDVRTTMIYADVLGEDRMAAADAIDQRLHAAARPVQAAVGQMKPIRSKTKQNSQLEAAK